MREERLPDAELEVLACIWHRGRPTAREIREALSGYRPLAHASVVTLLKRLEERGLVRRARGPVGKAFVYQAVHSPERRQRKLLDSLVERIFGGSSVALVASLLESRPPDAREVDELRALLDRLEGEGPEARRARKEPSRRDPSPREKGRKSS